MERQLVFATQWQNKFYLPGNQWAPRGAQVALRRPSVSGSGKRSSSHRAALQFRCLGFSAALCFSTQVETELQFVRVSLTLYLFSRPFSFERTATRQNQVKYGNDHRLILDF